MIREEFIKYIESIGFKLLYRYPKILLYEYGKHNIDLYEDYYYYYTRFPFEGACDIGEYNFNNLRPFETNFKKELRSIKLKKLLY